MGLVRRSAKSSTEAKSLPPLHEHLFALRFYQSSDVLPVSINDMCVCKWTQKILQMYHHVHASSASPCHNTRVILKSSKLE